MQTRSASMMDTSPQMRGNVFSITISEPQWSQPYFYNTCISKIGVYFRDSIFGTQFFQQMYLLNKCLFLATQQLVKLCWVWVSIVSLIDYILLGIYQELIFY